MSIQFFVAGIFEQLGQRFSINVGTDGLESDLCWGVVLNSQAVYSQFLTKHAGPYNYLIMDDIVNGAPMIRLIRRAVNAGIEIDAAVNQKDCIFRSPDQPVIKYNRVDPSSLPRTVELQYISFDRDFAVNTQYARNEGARVQQNILSSAIDFILSDDQARDMAYDLLWRIWMQQLSVTFEHPDLTLEPGDIVQMQTDNGVYVVQITTSLITKEPMNSSDFGRTNQLNANLLLTRRGATVPPGQVNQSSASSGTFVITAGATVLGVGDPPVVDGEFTITAGATVAGVGDLGHVHSHTITISEGQSVSLIETKGTNHSKAINISQSEAVTRTGVVGKRKTINISSPETVTRTGIKLKGKAINISQSETVTRTGVPNKVFGISQAETLTLVPARPPTTLNTSDKSSNITLSNGNLTATFGSASDGGVRSVSSKTSGKYYVEFTPGATWSGGDCCLGIALGSATISPPGTTTFPFTAAGIAAVFAGSNPAIWFNGAFTGDNLQATGIGSLLRMAVDLDNKKIWFNNPDNGTRWNENATFNPATNTGGLDISALFPGAGAFVAVGANQNGASATVNFGGSAFIGAVPSGFTAGWPA
jgi:hypothetical protein